MGIKNFYPYAIPNASCHYTSTEQEHKHGGGHAPQQWRAVEIMLLAQEFTYIVNIERKFAAQTYLDTLALGQGDPGLVLSNDEDVGLTGSEGVVNSILDVDDIETTIVTFPVGDDTNTTHVTATSDHADNTGIKADEVGDLASGNVDLHSVIDLDGWVRVADAI